MTRRGWVKPKRFRLRNIYGIYSRYLLLPYILCFFSRVTLANYNIIVVPYCRFFKLFILYVIIPV